MDTTIIISSLALLVSAAAFGFPYLQSQRDEQRDIKSQLTDVLGKLMDTLLDNSKLPTASPELVALLNQRYMFLLKQAVYLSNQAPKLVNDIEYNTIAFLSIQLGENLDAEQNYKKAIDASPEGHSRAMMVSTYANFLFACGRPEDARKQYDQATSMIKEGDEFLHYRKGMLYLLWGSNEKNLASETGAEQAFEKAGNEFRSIDNRPYLRQDGIERLDAARAAPSTVPAQPPQPLQVVHGAQTPSPNLGPVPD